MASGGARRGARRGGAAERDRPLPLYVHALRGRPVVVVGATRRDRDEDRPVVVVSARIRHAVGNVRPRALRVAAVARAAAAAEQEDDDVAAMDAAAIRPQEFPAGDYTTAVEQYQLCLRLVNGACLAACSAVRCVPNLLGVRRLAAAAWSVCHSRFRLSGVGAEGLPACAGRARSRCR